MAPIGFGYGSEFQLLRFMGHHRELLEKEICSQIGTPLGQFRWLDFDFSDRTKVITGDKERTGLNFLYDIPFLDRTCVENIISDYNEYKINNINSWQSWDAIFTLNNTIYLVEAKAYVKEMSPTPSKKESSDEILRFMRESLPNITITNDWMGHYYQLANRLATTSFLKKRLESKGVSARTLCIFFINGSSKPVLGKRNTIIKMDNTKSDATEEDFKKAIQKEMVALGIKEDQVRDLMCSVFIDANPKK